MRILAGHKGTLKFDFVDSVSLQSLPAMSFPPGETLVAT